MSCEVYHLCVWWCHRNVCIASYRHMHFRERQEYIFFISYLLYKYKPIVYIVSPPWWKFFQYLPRRKCLWTVEWNLWNSYFLVWAEYHKTCNVVWIKPETFAFLVKHASTLTTAPQCCQNKVQSISYGCTFPWTLTNESLVLLSIVFKWNLCWTNRLCMMDHC